MIEYYVIIIIGIMLILAFTWPQRRTKPTQKNPKYIEWGVQEKGRIGLRSKFVADGLEIKVCSVEKGYLTFAGLSKRIIKRRQK